MKFTVMLLIGCCAMLSGCGYAAKPTSPSALATPLEIETKAPPVSRNFFDFSVLNFYVGEQKINFHYDDIKRVLFVLGGPQQSQPRGSMDIGSGIKNFIEAQFDGTIVEYVKETGELVSVTITTNTISAEYGIRIGDSKEDVLTHFPKGNPFKATFRNGVYLVDYFPDRDSIGAGYAFEFDRQDRVSGIVISSVTQAQ